MNGTALQRRVLITNAEGLHLRPMAAFAEMAARFQCQVTVAKGRTVVDGKSMVGLMGLAAEQGTVLVLEATGPAAPAALDALLELFVSLEVGREATD